jgi:hypothetical protein
MILSNGSNRILTESDQQDAAIFLSDLQAKRRVDVRFPFRERGHQDGEKIGKEKSGLGRH